MIYLKYLFLQTRSDAQLKLGALNAAMVKSHNALNPQQLLYISSLYKPKNHVCTVEIS